MKIRPGIVGSSLLALAISTSAFAQVPPDFDPSGQPNPVPPAVPKRPPPENASGYKPVLDPAKEDDRPWGVNDELLQNLYEKADSYRTYTKRFTCNEVARLARYDRSGEVTDEKVRRYGYLLTALPNDRVHEIRQEFAKDGSIRPGAVDDQEIFPPAYAWVFLFSRFNEPYFSYRLIDDRFDGFDWVLEFEFRGSLPFTTGKDIRQWQGRVIVDAVTKTPIEIIAEPVGQSEKIEALYRRWSGSFNVLGMRTGPKPEGFQARIQFRHRKKDVSLTFPTELRYDTFRAVSPHKVIPVRASTRKYDDYKVYVTSDTSEIGEPVGIPEP